MWTVCTVCSEMCLVACVILLYLAVFLCVRAVIFSEYQIHYRESDSSVFGQLLRFEQFSD